MSASTSSHLENFLNTVLNGPSRYVTSHHYNPYLSLVIVLGVLVAEFALVYLVALLLVAAIKNIHPFISFVLRRCGVGEAEPPRTFLTLTFPSDTTKSAYATEQLHILLRSLVRYSDTWDKLAARKKPYSLELVGTHDDGIRYMLVVPRFAVEIVSRNLISFLPGLKVKEADDYMQSLKNVSVGVVELKLVSDFALPLQNHKVLTEHDPYAYLAGHMTKLAENELVAFQIVTTPIFKSIHYRVIRRANKLRGRIALGKEVSSKLTKPRTPLGYFLWLLYYPPVWYLKLNLKLFVDFMQILGTIFSSDHELPEFMNGNRDKRRSENPYEKEIVNGVKTKLSQHLFEVSMRVLVASPDKDSINSRLEALVGSFQPFTSTYQAIGARKDFPVFSASKEYLPKFRRRELSAHHLSQQTILSSSELSDLYHFPNTDLTKTEGFVKSRSKELPAPLSIKHSDAKFDVTVGVNKHGGTEQPIGLTLEQRQKHTYVIGKTGTGKTTLLTNSIYQDMVNGKGLAVLDPHGDMFRELLSIAPEHRKKDVIVLDPSDRAYPIGLNILAPGVHFDNDEDAHEWITSMVLSVFQKLSDETFWGPRMEHILRSATLTALTTDNPSLYTLQRLLTDKKYYKGVAKTLDDPILKQFWSKEVASYGDMQFATMVAPLTQRLGHFITTKMSHHILLQQKSTMSISDIMNEGKILLVNLSKGDIGEDQSFFFGTLLTSLIWMAAYQRTKIPEKKRRDFFVYVDEFQNFATPQFTDITSEGRKFHVSLTASHQNTAQIKDVSVLKTVAANVSSIICLKASPDDEAFILPFMQSEVEKGDIVNLAPHKFYMKTTHETSEDAFSGNVVPLDVEQSTKVKNAVLTYSRKHYATPRASVESYLKELLTTEKTK
jgi:Type IV secretion-system coupling protein DNA-binding domain